MLLYIIAVISLAGLFLLRGCFIYYEEYPRTVLMKQSVELTQKWFDIVTQEKQTLGIITDSDSHVKYHSLIGDDFSIITTTLGSLEAKEVSTNPEFSAVITKILLEQDIDSNSKVGLVISGSFPALVIESLASLQTIGADVILISSLGASCYGANQPDATWIDIENWLIDKGGLKYKSSIVTIGAENDIGDGLMKDGVDAIKNAAQRNNVELYFPLSIENSINYKTDFLKEKKIDLLINIGGNQAAVGACPHASVIPNGMNTKFKPCADTNRGIINRMYENGVPFLHLLNIKDLAVKNGLPLEPGITYGKAPGIYSTEKINKPFAVFLIILITALLFYYRKIS